MKSYSLYIIILTTLILYSCKKEIVFFDSPANEELEVPLLLNFNNKSCLLDVATNTLKYAIKENEIDNFSPFVEFKDSTEILFNNALLLNHDINELGTVKINTPYTIQICTKGILTNFNLYFTTLPLIQIVTLDEIKTDPKVFGRLTVNYPKDSESSFTSLIGIETRGASSNRTKKKSYGFKLITDFNMDNEISRSFFDMRKSNKWILDAMSVDKARLRNKTNYEIWNSLSGKGQHIGIKSRFVEVYLNSNHLGIYCFNENVTGEFLSLKEESVLIVGKNNDSSTKFEKLPHQISQNNYWGKWEQKYPDPETQTNWNNFEKLCQLIVESEDEEFANEIFQRLDKENVIDYFLFVNLFYGYDNVGKNWFYVQQSPQDKFEIIPWDLDSSWGRNHESEKVKFNKLIKNGLFARLIEVNPSNYKNDIKTRWTELRKNEFSKTILLQKFEYNFSILKNSNVIDQENKLWKDNLDLHEENEYITDWLTNRLMFLDSYIENL